MRTAALIASLALLAVSAGLAAQAPDESFKSGTMAQPIFPHDAKLSFITGHLAAAHPIGSFPCPKNAICLDGVWDDTFADMKTLLGPVIDPRAHVRSVHDAGVAGNPVMGYVVKPDTDGQVWAIGLSIVHNGRACFDRSLADAWPEFAADPRTRLSKDEICVRLK